MTNKRNNRRGRTTIQVIRPWDTSQTWAKTRKCHYTHFYPLKQKRMLFSVVLLLRFFRNPLSARQYWNIRAVDGLICVFATAKYQHCNRGGGGRIGPRLLSCIVAFDDFRNKDLFWIGLLHLKFDPNKTSFRGTKRPICWKMYYYTPVNKIKCY